ncbi:MAG: ABC transporter permease [Cardiobacteriaceae bacterium]|nr:ABC transporter permease [Cardiobacteriaceae bacterium]
MTTKIPVPLRARTFGGKAPRWQGWLMFAALLLLWELVVRAGWISRTFIASPAEILIQLKNLVVTGALWQHLWASLRRLLLGWGLGSVIGIIIGLMIGLWRDARGTLLPLVSALFPVPKIALLPLFLVWFGIDEGSKVATILIGTLFPTVIATYAAVDHVDRNLIRMGQAFGLPQMAVIGKIILPGAMPGIFAGFRISISIAITMLVVAEMMNADQGIGAYIASAGQLYQMDQLLAGVTLLSLLGLVLSWLLGICEHWILRWRD